MNRIANVAGACLFLLLAMAVPAAGQANVAGSWTLTFESPEYAAELSAVFAQNGSTVTGAVDVPMFEATEVSEGLIEENKLTLLFRFRVSVDASVVHARGRGRGRRRHDGGFGLHGGDGELPVQWEASGRLAGRLIPRPACLAKACHPWLSRRRRKRTARATPTRKWA